MAPKPALIAFGLLVVMCSRGAADPPSYPLGCRGGGLIRLTAMESGYGDFHVYIDYEKSGSTAFLPGTTTPNLQPGQCAWFDRALLPDEPASIHHVLWPRPDFRSFILDAWTPPEGLLTAYVRTIDVVEKKDSLPYFPRGNLALPVTGDNFLPDLADPHSRANAGSLVDPNAYFTFEVFAEAGEFKVTRVRCRGLCPAAARSRISVVSGIYGGNCGAFRHDVGWYVAEQCDGLDACDYRVDYTVIGDPVPGCAKDFVATYHCSDGSSATATAPPEAGFGSIVTLRCY